MRTSHFAALALTCVTVSTAFAQKAPDSVYGELGFTQVTISNNTATYKPSALRAIVGYEMNRNFSVEGMLAMGAADGSTDVEGTGGTVTVKTKIDSMYGLFAKAKAEVASGVELFGRVGYSKANLTTTTASASGSDSADGFAWGLGASYAVSSGVALNVDYMSYYIKDGAKATGPTFGVSFKF